MIRPVRDDDFDAAFALLSAQIETTREELGALWAVPGFAAWVADEDGTVTGYASLDDRSRFELAAHDSGDRSLLVGAAAAAALRRGLPQLEFVTEGDEDLTGLGFARGTAILRMWRDLSAPVPEPHLPEGVSLRAYGDADAGAVHALLDAAYLGWDDAYVPMPHDGWTAFMTAHDEFDPALWLLAERDGELVGCALHWREAGGRGWVKDLVVTSSERGRGLGRGLLHAGLQLYRERGARRVGLKVDETNPTGAPGLYASAGFVTDRRYTSWLRRP